jgi:hypothetical protein
LADGPEPRIEGKIDGDDSSKVEAIIGLLDT